MLQTKNEDVQTNAIGPGDMQLDYLTVAGTFLPTQLAANVILEQPDFDTTGIDISLATTITTYQQRMKSSATSFLSQLAPAFITTIADAGSFSALVLAFAQLETTGVANAYSNQQNKAGAVNAIQAVAQQANAYAADALTAVNNWKAVEVSIASYSTAYDTALSAAINEAGATAASLSATIDAIQAAINQDINDIVSGGQQFGDAVTQMGTGILTTISGAAQDPDPKDAGNGKDTTAQKAAAAPAAPDVSFVVQAIQSGSAGIAKASTAQKAMDANNAKLATAYGQLAQENTLISIAKAIQVQDNMFTTLLNQFGSQLEDIHNQWITQNNGFTAFANSVNAVSDAATAQALAAQITAATPYWNTLASQINTIKTKLARIN